MNGFELYIVNNFPLLLIAIGMFFVVFYDSRMRTKTGFFTIGIIITAILLSIFGALSDGLAAYTDLPDNAQIICATVFSFFGYITRPLVIYYFILIAADRKRKEALFLLIPAGVNLIIYSLALFPGTSHLVYFFTMGDDGIAHWNSGTITIFRFAAHIIAALYLIYLVYLSLKGLRRKHFEASITILICAVFIVAAVIVETLTEVNNLLNVSIAISCMFYYSFLHNQVTRVDILTKLFTRATYYRDIESFGNKVNAVVNIDMNGLKYLNDTFGHEEGDKALVTIANAIIKHRTKEMYAYRLGGDEYIILGLRVTKVELDQTCQGIKDELQDTNYSCSIGAVYKTDKNQTLEVLIKEAEVRMYKDKEEFYKTSKIERRKVKEV